MYKFKALKKNEVIEYSISIEKLTHLMVVEQKFEDEEYPRYIRLTGQQVKRLKKMLFTGSFSSNTIPVNSFELNKNDTFVLCCREENQVICIPHSEMNKVFDYYSKHVDHIARYDAQFRSRR